MNKDAGTSVHKSHKYVDRTAKNLSNVPLKQLNAPSEDSETPLEKEVICGSPPSTFEITPRHSSPKHHRKPSPRTANSSRKVSGGLLSSPIQWPVVNLLKQITDKVTTYEEWEKRCTGVILNEATMKKQTSSESIELAVNSAFNQALNQTTFLTRIEAATKLLTGVSEFEFLNSFLKVSNPITFWQKCRELDTDRSEFLYEVIGGEEPKRIISECSLGDGDAIKKVFLKNVKERFLSSVSYHFEECFDFKNMDLACPIAFLNSNEARDTFQYYAGDATMRSFAKFNNKVIYTPSNKQKPTEGASNFIIEWIIETLNTHMNLTSPLSPQEQLELFAANPTELKDYNEDKLKQSISRRFSEYYENRPIRKDAKLDLNCIFDHIGDYKLTKKSSTESKLKKSDNSVLKKSSESSASWVDFSRTLLRHSELTALFLQKNEGYAQKKWDVVAADLLLLYFELYRIEEKHEKIPCLAMLKAMLNGSFTSAEILLKKNLCPSLCEKKQFFQEEEKDFITYYNIFFEPKDGSFQVMHIRPHKVCLENTASEMTILVNWKVCGSLNSLKYSTRLEFDQWSYSSICSIQDRYHLMDSYKLDVTNNPFGSSVQKHEKQVTGKVTFPSAIRNVEY